MWPIGNSRPNAPYQGHVNAKDIYLTGGPLVLPSSLATAEKAE
jgi:hypothetical protein